MLLSAPALTRTAPSWQRTELNKEPLMSWMKSQTRLGYSLPDSQSPSAVAGSVHAWPASRPRDSWAPTAAVRQSAISDQWTAERTYRQLQRRMVNGSEGEGRGDRHLGVGKSVVGPSIAGLQKCAQVYCGQERVSQLDGKAARAAVQ